MICTIVRFIDSIILGIQVENQYANVRLMYFVQQGVEAKGQTTMSN